VGVGGSVEGGEGEPEDEACPAVWGIFGVEGAVVGVGDGAGDGQSEAGASLVAAACGIEPGEALKDAFPVAFGDTLAVVDGGQFGAAAVAA
jgi:hypothetical protein